MNNTDVPHTVAGGGTGYALAASNGVARCVIANGTVIPPRGRYLGVNSLSYSLSAHPAGNGTTATGDATFTSDIPDNAGLALLSTSVAANFILANRLDAVGSTSEANTLYKEGTGYPALVPFSVDHAFVRDQCGKGAPSRRSARAPAAAPSSTRTTMRPTSSSSIPTGHRRAPASASAWRGRRTSRALWSAWPRCRPRCSTPVSLRSLPRTSTCDIDGDGHQEFITGAGPGGGPHLRVWSVASGRLTELAGSGFFVENPAFPGGVSLTCRDLTGDAVDELITAQGPGGTPEVRIWSVQGTSLVEVTRFFAYNPAFVGGVNVAVGDVTGDGVNELITGAGAGGGPHVRVWSVMGGSVSELTGFFSYHPAFPGGGPHVREWSLVGGSLVEVAGFFAYNPAFPGGVRVGR